MRLHGLTIEPSTVRGTGASPVEHRARRRTQPAVHLDQVGDGGALLGTRLASVELGLDLARPRLGCRLGQVRLADRLVPLAADEAPPLGVDLENGSRWYRILIILPRW